MHAGSTIFLQFVLPMLPSFVCSLAFARQAAPSRLKVIVRKPCMELRVELDFCIDHAGVGQFVQDACAFLASSHVNNPEINSRGSGRATSGIWRARGVATADSSVPVLAGEQVVDQVSEPGIALICIEAFVPELRYRERAA